MFYLKKMVEEHLNLCHSHRVSTKKVNGDFGVCYPNSDIEYGKRRIPQDAWWHSIILIDKSNEQKGR